VSLFTVTLTFEPVAAPLDGRHVTAKGLHGLLFAALKEADPEEAGWLHDHPSPKPFSLAPLYAEGGVLAGLRLGAVSARAARLFVRAWEWHGARQSLRALGHQTFLAGEVGCVAGPTWAQLAAARPARRVGLAFLSPTTFRQGPGHMPLPLPFNVFSWPWRVWQAHGPAGLPQDWLEWCRLDVFVTAAAIETVPLRITPADELVGFVGGVTFETKRGTREQLSLLHALARLAGYTGVGHKTTMGMGAVALVEPAAG
jgi:CRISPR-associated endoribonuclease Cas6